jgi:hypothetical protein
MTTTKSPQTVHDTIDDITTTVEDMHRAIAALPLEVLAVVPPLHDAMKSLRGLQERSIHSIYGMVRDFNHSVRDLVEGETRA